LNGIGTEYNWVAPGFQVLWENAMNERCRKCYRELLPGERIVQVARGRYWPGYETPTYKAYGAVVGEWHEECFDEFGLDEQEGLYHCALCGKSLGDSDEVVYAVRGLKPRKPYIRRLVHNNSYATRDLRRRMWVFRLWRFFRIATL